MNIEHVEESLKFLKSVPGAKKNSSKFIYVSKNNACTALFITLTILIIIIKHIMFIQILGHEWNTFSFFIKPISVKESSRR